MRRWIAASAILAVVPGCVQPGNRWETSFNIAIESKLDENNKVTGGIQVKTSKAGELHGAQVPSGKNGTGF
jgi:hypothetical protein